MKNKILILISIIIPFFSFSQEHSCKIALLKYNGGGDWYANPTSLPNLIKFCNKNLGTDIDPVPATVEVGSPDIFNYPFIHATGHGNIVLSEYEAQNMRNYLMAGGFWHVDDNYGLDIYIRNEFKKIFPELELVELPFSHPIYHQYYEFKTGLPKIHEHDAKSPQGFGLIYQGRLVVFYSYETDLGDGWEDEDVHHDSFAIREQALKMGANIIRYVFEN